jgi:hypothetical protein
MAFEKFSNILDAMSYTGHPKFHLMFLYHKDSKKVWKTPRKKRRIRIMALSNFKQTLFSWLHTDWKIRTKLMVTASQLNQRVISIWCSHFSCASHVFHGFCIFSPFTAFPELGSNQTKCHKIQFINSRKREQEIASGNWKFWKEALSS